MVLTLQWADRLTSFVLITHNRERADDFLAIDFTPKIPETNYRTV